MNVPQRAGPTVAPPSRPEPDPAGERHARLVLAVVTLSSFFVPFMSAATNVALPRIAQELGIDAPVLSWVNTSYMLAAAALLLPLGRLSDLRGRRTLYLGGMFAFAVITAVVALAPSQNWLLGLRLVQGAVGAVPLAASMPLLMAHWPQATRGRALGINVAGVYTGLSVGPVLGGVLTQALGWRSIFLLTAAMALAVAVIALVRLPPERAPERAGPLDVPGSLLAGFALCALMLGLAWLPRPSGFALFAASALALVGFAVWERRARSPLVDVRLFIGNPVFLFSNLAALINYCATAAVGFLLSLYLQRVQGLDPRGAGLILVVQPALMAALSTPAGKLSERVEPRVLATLGMALTTVGLLVLVFVGESTPMAVIVAALAVLGVAFALFSSPNTNAVMSSVERRDHGIASATLGTMRGVGQMLSLGICGLLFGLFIGHVRIQDAPLADFLHSMRVAFGFFAALSLIGVFASRARGKVHG